MIPIDTGLVYYKRLYEEALALYKEASISMKKAEEVEAEAAILLGFDSNLFTVIKRAVLYPNGIRQSRRLIHESRKLYGKGERLRKKAGATAKLAEQARTDLNPLAPFYPKQQLKTQKVEELEAAHTLIDLAYSSLNGRKKLLGD